jgi:UDP-N-acetylglucosamine transferase subunit ALG13
MRIDGKIRLLRERLGLDLRQAKEALIICLEGVTLDDHQEKLARQIAENLDGVSTQHDGDAGADVAEGGQEQSVLPGDPEDRP